MNGLTLSVPVELPSPDRLEELIREGARLAAKEQLEWLTIDQAAEVMQVTRRTFERKLKQLAIPVSTIDGIIRIARCDVDAVLLANLSTPDTVVAFPSKAKRDAVLKKKEAA